MNTFAVAGLLIAGAMANSYPVVPAVTPVLSTPVTSSHASAIPTSTPHVGSSLATAVNNGTAPVWSYFNVTVTSVVVVQELTTRCKEATTLTFNDCEYPATKGELIVVTNCPCTVTTAIPTLTSSICPPGVTKPVIPGPPPVEVAPVPSATPTAVAPGEYPTSSPVIPPIQVGGAEPAGNANALGFILVAAAVALGL
ncbi:hypothetical protein SAMD00023353_0102390 [Rosellinia necatrix]|uniref:Uncharacterized protein n=1 Tax=Rosellinia necatrix TaxID=77044 RepID=A0A1S7UHR8_ROSNE|nr:hypothetical protein SAMD00023353_0102390 [Rosellinia necatrix]